MVNHLLGRARGQGDELELPADGTLVGDYVFVEEDYSDMSFAGLRQRTKDLDLNGGTNKVKSIKFKEYCLVALDKDVVANVVAVKFVKKQTMTPILPTEHVSFVRGTIAFQGTGGDPNDAPALCEYLSIHHILGRPVDDIRFHHRFDRGIAGGNKPARLANRQTDFSAEEISALMHRITEHGMPRKGGKATAIVRDYLSSRMRDGINSHVDAPGKYEHYSVM